VSDDVNTAALADVEEELYGVDPADFVGRRKQAETEARQRGDRDLAAAIGKLRKPSAAAWAIDSFAREFEGDIDSLLKLGDRLRDAVEHGRGDEIRRLMHERSASVRAVTAGIREHADAGGHPVSDTVAVEIERTLRAAMASDEYADAVRRGVLVRALDEPGLLSMDLAVAPRTYSADSRTSDRTDRTTARNTERVARAERELERTRDELTALTERRVEAEARRRELRKQLDDVEDSLRERQAAESDADARFRAARTELRRARTTARRHSS
jgi:hypothetical protein